MSTQTETSDGQLLDLLRRRGALSITDLVRASEVTATAVRQRLTRLMGQGLIEREVKRVGRGRPSHRYTLTEKARRQAGSNFADLAIVLWNELRAVKDPEVRRGLLQRLTDGLVKLYGGPLAGATVEARMDSLQELFAQRRVPLEISTATEPGGMPTLTVLDCPYPDLAEQDRGICSLERMLFAELLDSPLRLSQCRLDGHACCQFETN